MALLNIGRHTRAERRTQMPAKALVGRVARHDDGWRCVGNVG